VSHAPLEDSSNAATDAQGWLARPFTRRQMLITGLVGGVGATLGAGWSVHLYSSSFFDQLSVAEYQFQSPHWPGEYPDLTIAFLTDLHVGCRSVMLKDLPKIVQQVNALDADIILLGGDYLTDKITTPWQPYEQPEPIAEILKSLKASLGVYSVLGNHDWYSDGEGMREALQNNGIHVLENQSVFVPFGANGFWIVGLADHLTRTPNMPAALAEVTGPEPKLILSHDPITFKEMPNDAVLQLSGHTHGGQVRVPFLGPIISPTPGTPFHWFYGMVQEQGRSMIVSSGVGTSRLPIKNTPCEVVKIRITSLEGNTNNG
jgi:uncharacterized protein